MGQVNRNQPRGLALQQDENRPDYQNEAVFRRNCLPARSYHIPATSLLLNGSWDFHMASTPAEAPEPNESDAVQWGKLTVPGHWQLQGHGKPWYTNVQFPIPVCPPMVPTENPTGTYKRQFFVPSEWNTNTQLRLRFDGVDSAYHVWVNGVLIGYAQGSRNASEFDISDIVDRKSSNEVVVRVYQWSDGTYIEDQDQWWLSGIFRDVHLIAMPAENRIDDWFLKTDLDKNYQNGTLHAKVDTLCKGNGKLTVTLSELAKNGGQRIGSGTADVVNGKTDTMVNIAVHAPEKWTAETPYLYMVEMTLEAGSETHTVQQRIGFRKVELINGLMTVNGTVIRLQGVNRHEHHPHFGRAVPLEFAKRDILIMKQNNINALRLCHQPPHPGVLDLCDELGLWVVGEADLECHGFYDAVARPLDIPEEMDYEQRKKLAFAKAAKFTSDNPAWTAAYLDRMRSLIQRDKNHSSIIIWSFGNEAFFGRNFKHMEGYTRQADPDRLIHYEGDPEAETTDMYSYMYASPKTLLRHANESGVINGKYEKPVILCEYGHAMGNGPGLLEDYEAAFRSHERLQGGFVWEWANHGLWKEEDGKGFYAYGGDFGDYPNDSTFVMDGLLNSRHEPTPGLIEYKKVIAPVKLSVNDGQLVIENHYNFIDLGHLAASYSIESFGEEKSLLASGNLDLPSIPAGQTATVPLPTTKAAKSSEEDVYISVSFKLRQKTTWADTDHEVAWHQHKLASKLATSKASNKASGRLSVDVGKVELTVKGDHFSVKFNKARGLLTSWFAGGQELLQIEQKTGGALIVSSWRPTTDNDAPVSLPYWHRFGVDQLTSQVRSVQVLPTEAQEFKLRVKSFLTPPVLAWGWECDLVYTVTSAGVLRVEVNSLTPTGTVPDHVPRIGLDLCLQRSFDNVKWYGRGPGESYPDKKSSQRLGIWSAASIDDLQTPYDVPQENGNRMDSQWVKLLSEDQAAVGIRVHQILNEDERSDGFSFAVSHYSPKTIQDAKHPFDLHDDGATFVRLDARSAGLGTQSCGPPVAADKLVKCEAVSFGFELSLC